VTRSSATLVGFCAVLLWALLAVLTVATDPVPAFQLNALTFAIGGLTGLVWTVFRGRLAVLTQIGWQTIAFGTLGLFGYHALYFTALRLAPPAEASLVAYLWPLLIVLFSGVLLKEPLKLGHYAAAFLGFLGATVIVLTGRTTVEPGNMDSSGIGLTLAFLCALTWSLYSVLSRRYGNVPTEAVILYCIATSALSTVLHLGFETTVWPATTGWIAILALGIGPVGIAFFVWDIGMKHGDIRLLGATSYAAPLLSVLALVAVGYTQPTLSIAIAAALITTGALLAMKASKDS
jgi:drug/metabolite transporter (DMT)-like permease